MSKGRKKPLAPPPAARRDEPQVASSFELRYTEDAGADIKGLDGSVKQQLRKVLEKKLAVVYSLYGKADNFRSVVYRNTGHEYLPEMKDEMVQWFDRHLPVKK